MTTRFLFGLCLLLSLYGWAALGYRVANLPHYPLRNQTGEFVFWTDVLI
ncbi:hypothetical protein K9N68_05515 [Kovacikia minuta CCNUW1]|nr:hypothetical protein [Kovacikia minuta]UBF27409.1 hypothetical protein K9N68_05515 [Kovacikia minuta CCNUW1]